MSRHFFAGANTPQGFYNCFGSIIPFEKINKKVYIKGGSGTGKSTLMKKTAEHFEKKGFYAEYFHCSNDADSLDGVNITDLAGSPSPGIAVVDATAPHPADPQIPAAIDEIFNAADFLDKEYIRENKERLLGLSAEKKGLYDRAYGYLRAAGEVYALSGKIYESVLKTPALNGFIFESLQVFEDRKPSFKKARDRALFATSITPDGLKSLADSALKAGKTYVLSGTGAMGITSFIEIMQINANLLGLDTISFKSPMNPDETEHLYIRELDIAYVTSNRYHAFEGEAVEFEEFMPPEKLGRHAGELSYNDGIFDELLQKAIRTMATSKDVHRRIEEVYTEGMDFKRMHRAYDKVLEYLSE
jgi:hypothetical protein